MQASRLVVSHISREGERPWDRVDGCSSPGVYLGGALGGHYDYRHSNRAAVASGAVGAGGGAACNIGFQLSRVARKKQILRFAQDDMCRRGRVLVAMILFYLAFRRAVQERVLVKGEGHV